MGYRSYDKQWFLEQQDMIEELIALARTSNESVREYTDARQLENDRNYVRDVRVGIEFHMPQHAESIRRIRTWKEINRMTGSFMLHVGTENNYEAPTRQLKSSGGRMVRTGRLRGSPPGLVNDPTPHRQGQTIAWSQNQDPSSFEPVADHDVLDYDDPVNDENFHEVIPKIISVANGEGFRPPAVMVRMSNVALSTETVKGILDSLPAWVIEDSSQGDEGFVHHLTLRKRTSLES